MESKTLFDSLCPLFPVRAHIPCGGRSSEMGRPVGGQVCSLLESCSLLVALLIYVSIYWTVPYFAENAKDQAYIVVWTLHLFVSLGVSVWQVFNAIDQRSAVLAWLLFLIIVVVCETLALFLFEKFGILYGVAVLSWIPWVIILGRWWRERSA